MMVSRDGQRLGSGDAALLVVVDPVAFVRAKVELSIVQGGLA